MLEFNYTHKNHFKFGYDSCNYFQHRKSSDQKFTAEYGPVEARVENWRQANILAAQNILKNFSSKRIVICLSGGTDSEVCVRSFAKLNASFDVAVMKFRNDVNSSDVNSALQICRELEIQPKIFEIDILKFWESREFFDIIDPIRCVSPIIAAQLWLALQVDGVPIIAQGEPHFKKEVPANYVAGESSYVKSKWYLVESERLCSMYLCFIQRALPAVPGFFQYIPEQFQSYLNSNPILHKLFSAKIPGKLGTRTSKNRMIHQFYPEIPLREKLTGIEKVQAEHDRLRKLLAETYPDSDASCRIYLPKLCQQLGIPDEFSKYFS